MESGANTAGIEPSFQSCRERSLANNVVRAVDSGKMVSLRLAEVLTANDNLSKVTVRFITTMKHVYLLISSFPIGILKMGKKIGPTDTNLLIKRVGQSSGDILLQVYGKENVLLQAMNVFFEKLDSKGQHFTIRVLLPRSNSLKFPVNRERIKFEISKEPYGLVPGCLMTLSSSDRSCILSWAIRLSQAIPNTDRSSNLMGFRKSPNIEQKVLISKDTNVENGENNFCQKSSMTIDEQDEFETGVKLIELTRREVTYLIGKKGRRIEEIRKQTTAIIKVVPLSRITDQRIVNNPLATQFLRVSGTNIEVRRALKIIEADVYQFRSNGINAFY